MPPPSSACVQRQLRAFAICTPYQLEKIVDRTVPRSLTFARKSRNWRGRAVRWRGYTGFKGGPHRFSCAFGCSHPRSVLPPLNLQRPCQHLSARQARFAVKTSTVPRCPVVVNLTFCLSLSAFGHGITQLRAAGTGVASAQRRLKHRRQAPGCRPRQIFVNETFKLDPGTRAENRGFGFVWGRRMRTARRRRQWRRLYHGANLRPHLEALRRALTIVMAGGRRAGCAVVQRGGHHLNVGMSALWQPDDTFFDLHTRQGSSQRDAGAHR